MSKRVRFSNSNQVHVLPDTTRQTSREQDEQVEQLAGDYKRLKTGGDMHMDIASEAVKLSRANRRRRAGKNKLEDETGLLDDIEGAEEELEVSEDEEKDIPLEPFNLKREREEGTFSADGHWEEKRNEKKQPVGKFNEKGEYVIVKDEDEDEEADAWIDSLQEVKIDKNLASKLSQQAANQEAAYEDDVLDDDDKVVYKRRIASLLEKGETVLSALRRLGNTGQRGKDARRGRRQKTKNSHDAGAAGEDAPTTATAPSRPGQSSMPSENKLAFNKLTELADALLSNGEYNIYSFKREDLVGSSDIPAGTSQATSPAGAPKESITSIFAGAALGPQAGTQPSTAPAAADEDMDDMFGEEDAAKPAAGSTGTSSVQQDMEAEGGSSSASGASAATTSGAGAPPGYSGAVEGFQYDEGSGYYYNSQLGYWYDSTTGLYGDASTGLWYSYADGKYTLSDTAAEVG